ncbi:MAG: hypothetical protein KJ607_12955 [Bacteroidetes bacterium]|nr:hypothetical protein [Bacteroidota bacterium]
MKKIVKIYIRFVQKLLITILLTVLYITVFSLTKLLLYIFPGRYHIGKKEPGTYWLTAEGYTSDMDTAVEQS